MIATIVIGLVLAVLFGLAIRSIVKKRKSGGCCGSCKGCSGCNLSYEEIKSQTDTK